MHNYIMRSSAEHKPIETETYIINYPSMANLSFSNLEFIHSLQRYKPSIKVAFTKRSMNMNILVIGANGNAGRRIVEKALKAGHQVTGVVRREGAIEGIPTIVKDALQLTKQELTQFDVVVNATSAFTPDTYHLQTDLTLLLVKALANTNTRLIVVGGAGSLFVDEDHTVQLYDTPDFPAEFLGLAKAQGNAIDILRKFSNVDWTFFSPAPIFDAEGAESNDYVIGNETVILNKEGQPYISYETYAQILVDEINNHKFGRQRFTAVQN